MISVFCVTLLLGFWCGGCLVLCVVGCVVLFWGRRLGFVGFGVVGWRFFVCSWVCACLFLEYLFYELVECEVPVCSVPLWDVGVFLFADFEVDHFVLRGGRWGGGCCFWCVCVWVWFPLGLPPSIEARSCLELAFSFAVLILSGLVFFVPFKPVVSRTGCGSPFNGRTDGG
jgi:hypothetical protein